MAQLLVFFFVLECACVCFFTASCLPLWRLAELRTFCSATSTRQPRGRVVVVCVCADDRLVQDADGRCGCGGEIFLPPSSLRVHAGLDTHVPTVLKEKMMCRARWTCAASNVVLI